MKLLIIIIQHFLKGMLAWAGPFNDGVIYFKGFFYRLLLLYIITQGAQYKADRAKILGHPTFNSILDLF